MTGPIETVQQFLRHFDVVALLFDATIKSCIVLALAGVTCLLMRRGSAATRHWIWFLAVMSLPLLPLATYIAPAWEQPLWAVSASRDSGNQIFLTIELTPEVMRPAAIEGSSGAAIVPAAPAGTDAGATGPGVATRVNANWLVAAFGLWCGGILITLLAMLPGEIWLRRATRRSQPLPDWEPLLEDVRTTSGIRRRVKLLKAAEDIIPLTWGWREPVILLPANAVEWPEQRRRVVLLHELAHVKRQDCLTHLLTRLVCAFYWFNPLVWIASRRIRVERERAADDLVLDWVSKPSDYAAHLVAIARCYRPVSQPVGIAMARSSGLEHRIAAIVDGSRIRRLRPFGIWTFAILNGALIFGVGGWSAESESTRTASGSRVALLRQQMDQLKAFSATKERQAKALAEEEGEQIGPDYQQLFDAATRGDRNSATKLYGDFKRRHGQYASSDTHQGRVLPHSSFWSPVLEVCLAYDHVANCDPQYTQIAVEDIFQSIPPGSVYFGGTDPGRGLPTAFSKSHAEGDPFYTLTQNALADSSYLDYLRMVYGARSKLSRRLYTPSSEDSQTCFTEYTADAARRLQAGQLKPGEQVSREADGRLHVRGQVAVMEINARVAKIIFDKNPEREFYIEESFPLEWMYPHLSPNGLIMKIHREPLAALSEEVLRQDREHWQRLVGKMIGDWLDQDTPVQTIAAFVEKTFVRKDLSDFQGDPNFVRDNYAPKMFSKWRSSIGGIYAWRLGITSGSTAAPEYLPKSDEDRQRLVQAADLAFRQAFALCPYSSEAVFRYVHFLTSQGRRADALLIAETASHQDPENATIRDAVQQLRASLLRPGADLLEIRLVEDQPSSQTESMSLVVRPASEGGPQRTETLHVQKRILLNGTAVASAGVIQDPQGRSQVEIRFTPDGREQFARITRENLNRRLAIIVDGQLYSAPVVRSEIPGGTAQISGDFSHTQAEELARRINSTVGR